MARSLVLGVNGQDGSYLAETLLRRGYDVVGLGRDETSRYVSPSATFRYVQCDLCETAKLAAIVDDILPDSAYHMAAVHGPAGFKYEPVWRDMMAVNVLALHVLLEAARISNHGMRVIYAGSAKVFPQPWSGEIDETTPIAATCLYGIGKLASRELIRQYRDVHGIAGTNLILFNHESVRRRPEYFLPTIARAVAAAKRDRSHRTTVQTLDFRVDWSSAAELMDIAVDIAEKASGFEYVLASGRTWHGRAALAELFDRYGLNLSSHIVEVHSSCDPGPYFHVRTSLLERDIARVPVVGFTEIADELVARALRGEGP
jgi:GDPmannose 4,6-dehydratase